MTNANDTLEYMILIETKILFLFEPLGCARFAEFGAFCIEYIRALPL